MPAPGGVDGAAARPTLLEATLRRVAPLCGSRYVVVAPAHQKEPVVTLAGIPAGNVLVEPSARNTAPAVLLGAMHALAADPGAVVAVLPSDHAISPDDAFRDALRSALAAAVAHDAIVTFGIRPTTPSTGYGYLEHGEAAGPSLVRVAAFREKPDLATAERWTSGGGHSWNSGMFVFRAARLVAAFERLHPELAPFLAAALAELRAGPPAAATAALHAATPATSIDYAIMEKDGGLLMIPSTFSWSDVGAPSALPEHWPLDEAGNCVASGVAVAVEAGGNVVMLSDPRKVVALLGVDDLVVIDTPDALLVCPKSRDQDIRAVVAALKARGREDIL